MLEESRPTLVRLLDAGEIAFSQPGRHRRIRLADPLGYHQRASRGRAFVLGQMAADSETAGLYDLPDNADLFTAVVAGDLYLWVWAWMDLNHRPLPYQGSALTELSYRPSVPGGDTGTPGYITASRDRPVSRFP